MIVVYIGAAVLAVIGVLQASVYVIRRRAVARAGREEWSRLQEGDALAGASEAVYVRAYVRVYGPRGQIYVFLAALAALAVTPVTAAVLNGVWNFLWALAGRPAIFDEGYLVWQFYIYFGLLLSWVAAASLVANIYHRRRPGTLEEELGREDARMGGAS